MKVCVRCNERPIVRNSWCKECQSAYNKQYRANRVVTPAVTPGNKLCKTCDNVKTSSEFHPHKGMKDGLNAQCKACVMVAYYRRTYGLEPEQYQALLSQGCEACGDKLGRIVIDHCHETGKVRGSLCSNCNTALGLLAEDPLRMHNLANYILRTS